MVGTRTVAQSTRTATLALVGAVLADVVSIGLLFSFSLSASIVGYVLAPFLVTALVGYYRFVMIQVTQSLEYRPTRGQLRQANYVVAALVVSFVVGIAHSWVIATEIAKGLGA